MPTSSIYRPYFSPLVATIDLCTVITSGYLAYWFRFNNFKMDVNFQSLMGGVVLVLILSSIISGVYQSWRGKPLTKIVKRYTLNLWLVVAILAAFLVFTKSAESFSRLWLGYFILCIWMGGAGYRTLHYLVVRWSHSTGKNLRQVLLITSTDEASSKILASDLPSFGYLIANTLPITQMEEHLNSPLLTTQIKDQKISEIWINLPLSMGSLMKDIVYALRHETVDIRYLPDFEDIQLLNHKSSNIAGLHTIDISCSPLDGFNQVVKRAEDLILGSLITLLITPVCLSIALALKISSPGPILFKQLRNGLDGKQVKVYKFRSMEVHTEEQGQVTQATKGDPRVTKLGAFLRRTSLDELPQFYNVLQGRMSIVGPRPHALAHNEYYKDLVESYMWRHKVKPGITGWAQVNGLRGETDTLDKMEKRVEYDLAYIDNWSLWLDIKIIVMTVFTGFINKNAF